MSVRVKSDRGFVFLETSLLVILIIGKNLVWVIEVVLWLPLALEYFLTVHVVVLGARFLVLHEA